MVLTNFELWAADGASAASSLPLEYESSTHNRHHHLNPFDPRAVPSQLNTNLTHLSSNGYYGFSYINAAHDMEELNNNNNNNSTTFNFMANDVNGMNNNTNMSATTTATTIPPQTHAASANNFGCAVNVAGDVAANVTRCKKRFFVMNDAADVENDCTDASDKNHHGGFAKRCRFDDDFAAQYCNDFFSLPSTQIATQSCYMDTEEGFQFNPQQQVVGAMFENNNNNIEKFEQNLHLQLQNQPEQSQNTTQSAPTQQQQQQQNQQQPSQPQQQQQHLYHQQQHYQDMINKCHCNNSCDTLPLKHNHTCIKIDSQKTENLFKSHKSNFKVDDATLFAQIHGGCLHHFVDNTTTSTTTSTNNKDVLKHLLQDDNYFEEF